jgi:hypothetical protein
VRFLKDTLADTTRAAIGSRAGGEVVNWEN